MTSTSLHHDRHDPAVAPPVIGGIDHVEWWVGNARSFAALLMSSFGFEAVGYAGPETGRRDRVSHVLQQGRIRFVVTGALGPDSPISEHVRAHGDGVKDICFLVDDAEAAYAAAIARGAVTERPPAVDSDQLGAIHQAAIRTYGETVHTFLDRSAYTGPFAPGFGPAVLPTPTGEAVGLTRFDHIVGNVELGHLGEWVDYYREVLGFDQLVHFGDDQISTEYSALMSTVVWNHDKVVLPINEPAEGRRKSQIEEYLDYHGGHGIQHVALQSENIVETVEELKERGVVFLSTPEAYYEDAHSRVGEIDESWEDLLRLRILVDRDEDGYLLQIFTKTAQDRPTLFFEVIERHGARGFGEGNFKALFEAIEREQALRGNL